MQKVTILCVGKLKEKFYMDAVAEYQKRLSRFCKLDLMELPESRLSDSPSQGEIDQALSQEAEAIRGKLPKGAALIALCIEGKELSSPQLAEKLEEFALGGTSHLCFLIGGSVGLSFCLVKRRPAPEAPSAIWDPLPFLNGMFTVPEGETD